MGRTPAAVCRDVLDCSGEELLRRLVQQVSEHGLRAAAEALNYDAANLAKVV
ncbi:MAG: hypothetical protein U1D69_04670 [Polynucleobacter sp.]|nr:hypothetical protein [Polynucleobacter sp.]